jgi:hypothetical protein
MASSRAFLPLGVWDERGAPCVFDGVVQRLRGSGPRTAERASSMSVPSESRCLFRAGEAGTIAVLGLSKVSNFLEGGEHLQSTLSVKT